MFLCVHLAGLTFLSRTAQRPIVFGFSSAQLNPWVHVGTSLQRAVNTHLRPSSGSIEMVSVSGNFGGTLTVHGIGTATGSQSDEYVNINTNKALTFLAANFTTLYSGGSQATTAGSITYEMQLYAGTSSSVGAALTGAANGTDNGFNGGTLVLSSSSIPSDGNVVLRLSRTLNLTQLAEGSTTYTASGQIVLSIN